MLAPLRTNLSKQAVNAKAESCESRAAIHALPAMAEGGFNAMHTE